MSCKYCDFNPLNNDFDLLAISDGKYKETFANVALTESDDKKSYELFIELSAADDFYGQECIAINFCPMCGRKLTADQEIGGTNDE